MEGVIATFGFAARCSSKAVLRGLKDRCVLRVRSLRTEGERTLVWEPREECEARWRREGLVASIVSWMKFRMYELWCAGGGRRGVVCGAGDEGGLSFREGVVELVDILIID